MMIKENCFAFRSLPKKKDGFEWKEEKCDALTEFLCENKECPFYKSKDKVKKYQYKYGSSYYGVGYEDIR
jgi:hypothetical protein